MSITGPVLLAFLLNFVNFTQSGLPKKPIIYDSKGKIVSNITEALDENSNINLVCEVNGGSKTVNLTWFWENKLIDDSYEPKTNEITANYLDLSNVSRQHFNTKLACKAFDKNLTTPLTTDVMLNIALKPLSVKILNKQIAVSAEKTYEIHCETTGSHPQAVITWRKGYRRLPSNLWKNSHNLSILTFKPKMEDDDKDLICRGENLLIPGSVLEDAWKLNVLYPPVVTLKIGSIIYIDDVKEGDDIYFECKVRANPSVHKISWFIDSTQIHRNISAGIIISDGAIVFQSVSRRLSGAFTCLAENSESSKSSNPVRLKVKHKPELTIKPEPNLDPENIKEGENVSFECQILAYPTASATSWFLNGTKLNENVTAGIAMDDMNILFVNISRITSGQLTCGAINQIGSGKSEPIILHIRYAPVCIEDKEEIIALTPSSEATVKCTVYSDPPATSFHWSYDNSKFLTDIPEENYTSTFGFVSTSQLNYSLAPPFDYGNLHCWAENEVGHQSNPCISRILPKGTPLPLTNCAVIDQTIDTIRIHCTENFDGGLPQKFYMEILEVPSFKLKFKKTINKPPPIFVVKGVSIVKTYRILLYAINSAGRSKATIIDKFTLSPNNQARPQPQTTTKTSSIDSVLEIFTKNRESDSQFQDELLNELKGISKTLDEIRKELQALNNVSKFRAKMEYQEALSKHEHFDVDFEI